MKEDVSTYCRNSNDNEVQRSEIHCVLKIDLRGRRKRVGQQNSLNGLDSLQSVHLTKRLTSDNVINVLMSFVQHDSSQTISDDDDLNIRDKDFA